MIQSQWIELECSRCKKLDRMPLSQYLEYELYTCPYEGREGRCHGSMEKVKVRTLEFAFDKQATIF